MTRTERQQVAIKNWIANKGKGTIVANTGFGKSRCALMIIKALLKKNPQFRILVVVPTDALRKQWLSHIEEWSFQLNVDVLIINTVVKNKYICNLLILDEEHRYAADLFKKVFDCITYKYILGLTATFERLDGKHVIIEKYCPIVDTISKLECVTNGWVSDYKEYQVLIEVDDISTYESYNQQWIEHFEFFQFDFGLAMSTIGPNGWKGKIALRDSMYKGNDDERKKQILSQINYHSAGFIRTMQQRKSFINNHPKKIEIAKKIIEARQEKKIITFSNNVKMAEAIDNGNFVYTGKTSAKKGRIMIEDFISGKINRIHSCAKLNEGFDVPDISVGIILGFDSSETKSTQRKGRVTRSFEGKQAEVFYIVIKDSIETKWFKNAHKNDKDYITIDEQGLDKVLNGEEPQEYRKKIPELLFRF